MEELFGTVERIVFASPDGAFIVARVQEVGKPELTTVVGPLGSLAPGEAVRCQGHWRMSKHGMQLEVEHLEKEKPTDKKSIEKYLASGQIKGIGPAYATKIVDHFGEKTLQILDQSPDLLLDVKGIGKAKLKRMVSSWQESKQVHELVLFLQQYDVFPSLASRIYKRFGEQSREILEQNPFLLAQEVRGIGFKTADQIAQKIGLPAHDPGRIAAGVCHFLLEESESGHCCLPHQTVIEGAAQLLAIEPTLVEAQIASLIENKRIASVDGYFYLPALLAAEESIASDIRRLKKSPSKMRPVDADKAITWVQEKLSLQLAPAQAEAVQAALREKVLVITGGPGTGKSTITRAILTLCKHLCPKILLAAPTGRAAKRMTEITRWHARTIHSLLEWSGEEGGFKKNASDPLACDLIIIDEASMIDTRLAASLLRAIPSSSRLILIGDTDQLPSVGPGSVLKEIIASGTVPVFALKEIFRQGKDSSIVSNAHRINQGEFPELGGKDFFFLKEEDPEAIPERICTLLQGKLGQRFDLFTELQIMAPMRRGACGIDCLNAYLQEKLNPSNSPLIIGTKRLHSRDRIIQLVNNYDKEVFNGDIGRIVDINTEDQLVTASFDDRIVEYDFSELHEIQPAYAVSVHKYQGSETPCAIVVVHTSHFPMLQRNLLYTAITRASRLLVLIGSAKAIHMAIENIKVSERHTRLAKILQPHRDAF